MSSQVASVGPPPSRCEAGQAAGDRCPLGVLGWPASCTPSPAYPAIPASPAHYPGAWSRTTRQNNLQILNIILTFSKYGLVLVYTDEEQ